MKAIADGKRRFEAFIADSGRLGDLAIQQIVMPEAEDHGTYDAGLRMKSG
jgi:hypothetical protein